MSDLKKWYLGGMVVAADKAEFKEDEHPRGKGGMFVKKGEQKDDGKLSGEDFTFKEKNGVVTVLAPESVNVGQDVRKKMIDEINRKYPNKEFSFSKFSNGVSDGIKAVEVKSKGGGGSSALEEAYKKGGFKHPEALAKSDFEELGKMSDSRLDAEITMLKGKVEEGGKPLDKARLEAAEGIMKGRGEKSVKITSKEDYVKYAKKNFGDVFGKDIDSMSLKDLGRYREFLDWRVGLPSTAGGLHQTLRRDIEDLITEREKALAKAGKSELKKADTKGKIEGNGEESLKKAISELSDERLDVALKNGERNAKRDDLSEEQRKRYERTLPYLKSEKAKRGGNGGKISVAEDGKSFTVEGKLTNEQIKFLLFGNEDGHRHAGLTIDGIDCSITQEEDGKLILWGRAATSGMGQKGRIIKDGMKNIGKVSGRLGTLFFNPEKPNENPYKKLDESLKKSKKPSGKKIENDDDDWLD